MTAPRVPIPVLLLAWLAANALALPLGWWLGANDFDAQGLERSLRNAFYGAFIGACQATALALAPRLRQPRLLLWPLAMSIGFCLGVLLVKTIEPQLPPRPPLVSGLLFGVCIAPPVVLAQWLFTRQVFEAAGQPAARLWWAAQLVGWILVEMASARLGYQGVRIVIVGSLLGLVTVWPLWRLSRARSP